MSDAPPEPGADDVLDLLREHLLPQPRDMEVLPGELVWEGRTLALQLEGAFSAGTHQSLVGLLNRLCYSSDSELPMRAVCKSLATNTSNASGAAAPADESYELTLTAKGVELRAASEVGIARGARTLAQLLAMNRPVLPCVRISDAPALAWRGVLIDVARHFIELDELLRTIDGMAHHKLNVLHLHLSDDQAFRFPSAAYPRLNSFGPSYTREELAELVAYAADAGIRVVPELDMPGHTTSWLAAYPEWALKHVEATSRFGVHPACLDPTVEVTWQVIGTLVDELAEVFPDVCVHIGGDEVHPRWWREHERVQAFMAEKGFAEPRDLQAYFNQRLSELLAARGKRMLAWDEALHADLPRDTTIQAWRGMTARDAALAAGHDCIVSAPYYLDLFYPADMHTAFAPLMPLAQAVLAEDRMLEDVRLAHVAEGLAWTKQWRNEWSGEALANTQGAGAGRVIGAEACLWSELVDTPLLDVRLWSRLPLLAELFWRGTPAESVSGYTRIEHTLASWTRLGGPDLVPALCGAVSTDQMDLLAPLGVDWAHASLLTVIEPVKWYARLLGSKALAARLAGSEMPQARPYSTDSPLRGIADVLSPQSFRAAQLAELLARWRTDPLTERDLALVRELVDHAASCVAPLEAGQLAESAKVELAPLAQRFQRFGEVLAALLAQHPDTTLADETLLAIDASELRKALEPSGELMLSIVVPLLEVAEAVVAAQELPASAPNPRD